MNCSLACLGVVCALPLAAFAQSADWQQVIWREPQVRYLLGTFVNSGQREFISPNPDGQLDWVLVLDDAAKKFPVPGT